MFKIETRDDRTILLLQLSCRERTILYCHEIATTSTASIIQYVKVHSFQNQKIKKIPLGLFRRKPEINGSSINHSPTHTRRFASSNL